MRLKAAVVLMLAPLSACSSGESVPSGEENRHLDSAENLLNAAPDELDTVGERLPGPQ